jgi:hypothetical protein
MRVHGRCHCGSIQYEADVDPATVSICHCTDCQRLTGSAWRVSVPAPAASFSLTGTPKTYLKTTADSGTPRVHAFCPECGAPVYATSVGTPASYTLRVGCLDEREALAPKRRIWARSTLPWSTNVDAVPSIERQ